MQIRIKQSSDIRENIIRIDKRIILSTLRRSIYTPATHSSDAPVLVTHHTQTLKRATNTTRNPNFMMIPEVREFCFNIFLSFFIQYDIFFCVIRRIGRFMFQGQHQVQAFQKGIFFRNKYARLKGKRKIYFENRKALNMNI